MNIGNGAQLLDCLKIIGITRVRNEALIIEDTLRHALEYVDRIILYDDASDDETVEIAASFDRVEVIRGEEWRADRPAEETRHRALLQNRAKEIGAEWCWCFDADERLVGEFPDLTADGYMFRLFDGYLAEGYAEPYAGGPLEDLPRRWGPEYRDILMLFRTESAVYHGRDQREPIVAGAVELAPVLVKHFGKCLSVEHWEDTCQYYSTHWGEPYRSKWKARRGKAIHSQSDFGRSLYSWADIETNATWLV